MNDPSSSKRMAVLIVEDDPHSQFYFTKLLPFMGGLISKDREAYSYLPQSVLQFPDGAEFENHLKTCGMTPVKRTPLTLGIATIYLARK